MKQMPHETLMGQNGAAPDQSAWDRFSSQRVDLAKVIADGIESPHYLYEPVVLAGKVTCIFGGPEQGKTMLLLHIILATLRTGQRVLYLDEEVGIAETAEPAERLDAMGATADDLSRLDYFPFAVRGSLDEMAATILEGIVREQYALVSVDSISKLLAAAGLDENSNTDCTALMQSWITPVAHIHGAAVIYLDHVAKAEDDGRYGRGASSKLADTDVQWHIQATVQPSRISMGRLVLTRKKDRTATVPAKVTYLAGGDGTGWINVQVEGSTTMTTILLRPADQKLLVALHGTDNRGLRSGEWRKASGKPDQTFYDARKRLVDRRCVEQRDDLYRVTDAGIAACKDAIAQYLMHRPLPINQEDGTDGTD